MSKGNKNAAVAPAELAQVFRMSEALGLTDAEEVFAYELAGRLTTTAVQQSRRARKRPLVTCAAFSFALLRLMREDARGNGHRKTKTRKRKPRG